MYGYLIVKSNDTLLSRGLGGNRIFVTSLPLLRSLVGLVSKYTYRWEKRRKNNKRTGLNKPVQDGK